MSDFYSYLANITVPMLQGMVTARIRSAIKTTDPFRMDTSTRFLPS